MLMLEEGTDSWLRLGFNLLFGIGVFAFIGWSVIRAESRKKVKQRDHARNSDLVEAILRSSQQIGTPMENSNPKLRLHISYPGANGEERSTNFVSEVDYANIPRPGDKIIVSIDRRNPAQIQYVSLAANYLVALGPPIVRTLPGTPNESTEMSQ